MPKADPNLLSNDEWERHQEIIASFETAWKRGQRPKIVAHLPADEPRLDELLIELVHADLEFRIKAGEPARVEDYLRRFPSLSQARETVLGLIRAECSIRRRKEPGLKIDRFRRRFPDYRAELETPHSELSTHQTPSNTEAKAEKRTPKEKPARQAEATPGPIVDRSLPSRFGKFELKEKLGIGSFGVVYRAWDTVLQREVAVKIPHPEVASAKPELRVFLREARNAVGLKHPNIVEILDAGPIEDVDCLVRAYIEGTTLAERIRESQFTPVEAAELSRVVADAVEYANRAGIIHRDLKPSNILLDLQGRPHVSDFGLAKRESSDTTLSPSGSPGLMIGTPAYMAPEQARGETYLVDARSDVYSLGVMLYEVLTGSLPFRGKGRMLQIQIQDAKPVPPRSLNDEVPVDLETICLKALAKDPVDRYQSAGEMGHDLQSFLKGEPVGAKLIFGSELERKPLWKSWRRLAVASAWLSMTLALASTTTLWLRGDARRASNAEGLDRTYRALLGLAGMSDPGAIPQMMTRGGPSLIARTLADELAKTLEGDPDLVELVAEARLRLAERAMAEGSDREAGPAWELAIMASEASIRERPAKPSRLLDLGRALARLAAVRRRGDHLADSRKLFERSLSVLSEARVILEAQTLSDTDLVEAQIRLAEVILQIAEVRESMGESAGVVNLDSVARELGKYSWSSPTEVKARLAPVMLDLSRRQLAEGRASAAEDSAAMAFRLDQEVGRPGGIARDSLALARANRDLGRVRESADLYADTARCFQKLVESDGGLPGDRRDLGVAFYEHGRLLDRMADHADAIIRYRRSLAVRIDLDRDYPGAHSTLAELGEVRTALARDLESEGQVFSSTVQRLAAIRDRARAFFFAKGEPSSRRALAESITELGRSFRVDRFAAIR